MSLSLFFASVSYILYDKLKASLDLPTWMGISKSKCSFEVSFTVAVFWQIDAFSFETQYEYSVKLCKLTEESMSIPDGVIFDLMMDLMMDLPMGSFPELTALDVDDASNVIN